MLHVGSNPTGPTKLRNDMSEITVIDSDIEITLVIDDSCVEVVDGINYTLKSVNYVTASNTAYLIYTPKKIIKVTPCNENGKLVIAI